MPDATTPTQPTAPQGGQTQATEAATEQPSYLTRDEFNAQVNAAITAHTKRLEKAFEDRLAKLTAARPPEAAGDAGAAPRGDALGAPAAGPDPKLKLALEKLEQLERKAQEAESRARQVEVAAQQDRARATVRSQLETLGIKGVRAAAVMAHLEASKALRFDDEGKASIAVKRSRATKAPAEELAFEDLAAGVADWSKTDEAREFLPPPAAAAARAQAGGTRAAPPRFDKPAATADEALARTVAQLQAAGVDVDAAFRRG